MKQAIKVFINGKEYSPEQATVSVFDRGFLFGDAVYEVARSYGRVFFELEAHISRMFKSAELISLNLGASEQQFIEMIYRAYKTIPSNDIYMRIQITRGEGTIGLNMGNAQKPNIILYFRQLDKLSASAYQEGVAIVTSKRLRNSKRALDPNIKSGNYLNNVLAFQDAVRANAIESIMVNSEGLITEGTTSNIFCVKNGVLVTPPVQFDILQGITRRRVLDLAAEMKIQYEERGLFPDELEQADEVFLTSSTREVLPVSRVNDKKVNVPGPLTSRLAQAYKGYIEKYVKESKARYGDLLEPI